MPAPEPTTITCTRCGATVTLTPRQVAVGWTGLVKADASPKIEFTAAFCPECTRAVVNERITR